MSKVRTEKQHLQAKRLVVMRKIWDLLFLRKKLKVIREGFTGQYNTTKEQLDAATLYKDLIIRIGMEESKKYMKNPEEGRLLVKENPNPTRVLTREERDTAKSLESQIEKTNADLEQTKKQMDGVDGQLEGSGSVNDALESYRSVIGLLDEDLKTMRGFISDGELVIQLTKIVIGLSFAGYFVLWSQGIL